MGQVLNFIKSFKQTSKNKDIIFAYDLKSTSKHFIAGTLVINNVEDLVRYDDFEMIKRKKGLEIKSIGIYRAQNRIIGYEIVYKDATSGSFTLKRIPSGFNAFSNKTCSTLKLQHNEHLVDIDLVYTQDEIKYIEFMTSKGNSLKVGTQVEDGYTSFNKVDITQKNYASIIAFESTFSKDCLKELFIYRCPVRITKKKKKRKLTVVEINNLKKAPHDYDSRRAKQNLDIMRDFTRKGIAQLRVVKALQSISQGQGPKDASRPSLSLQSSKFQDYADERKSQEAYMEEQEYGAGEEDEDEVKNSKDSSKADNTNSIFKAPKKLIAALANRRDSQVINPEHFEKLKDKDKESHVDSPLRKFTRNLFGWKQTDKSSSGKNSDGEDTPSLNGKEGKSSFETSQKKAIDMRKSRKSVSGAPGKRSSFSTEKLRKTKTGIGLRDDKRSSVASDKPKKSPLLNEDDEKIAS